MEYICSKQYKKLINVTFIFVFKIFIVLFRDAFEYFNFSTYLLPCVLIIIFLICCHILDDSFNNKKQFVNMKNITVQKTLPGTLLHTYPLSK